MSEEEENPAVPLRRLEVKTFEEHMYHHGCGGEFVLASMVVGARDTKYVHRCNKCEVRIKLDDKFPRTVHEVPK